MGCCRGEACEPFTSKVAQRDLRRYRSKGLGTVERWMIRAASRDGVDGARVLEIGGGIGTLQAELLAAGAASGEVVELVPSYQPYAREVVESKGLAGRSTFRVLDILAEPGRVSPADVVLLNAVLCCTPDGLELTRAAAELTQGTLVLSFVRRSSMARLFFGVENLMHRLRGRAYRVFLRPTADIVAAAESAGLRLVDSGRSWTWEYVALSA
ncbi:MAG TPA: methyltransferase domain-containing protein [Jiangellaceae bacterium]|nr:methyltransferase domain-containing protein [Jiangellaceae bacterium]